MEAITRADAVHAIESAKRFANKIKAAKQSNEEGISAAFATGTAIVVGGAMAWANERFGDLNSEVGGQIREVLVPGTKLPADAAAAVLIQGFTFFGAFGKHAEHGHNVAASLFGGWAVRNGMAMGAEARNSAGKASTGWSPKTGARVDRQAA